MQLIENDAEIIYEGKRLRFDTTEGIQRAEAFIRMKEVIDLETGLKVPRTKVSFCYNSLTPKAPSEPFVVPCIEGRGRKKKGENIMTHVVMRFPESVCVPIAVRTQATRTVKGSDPITAKIALEIAKKWVKATYGNIDYMCGIHIDQPDMLVHFLLFVKEANDEGEENARKLFLAYHLDKFIENFETEESSEEAKEIEEDSKTETVEESLFSKDMSAFADLNIMESDQKENTNVTKKTTKKVEDWNEETREDSYRDEILSQMKQEAIYASKPSERQDQIDIASIVAKVRSSSSYQLPAEKEAKTAQQLTNDLENLFNSITVGNESDKDAMKEEISSEQQEATAIEINEPVIEDEKEKDSEPEKEPAKGSFYESVKEVGREDYSQTTFLDPIAQIKANAANQLFGLSQVLEPKMTTAEKEEKEMLEEAADDLKEVKAEIKTNISEPEEDKQLYPESEYAKTPVGPVVWGTEAAEDKFPEEKKVTAVFSTRNLSVMAEDTNPYMDDLEEELPEITFLVQNEAGEKEVPEEFNYLPSERTLQQRDAAASYVKSLKKAKWKKAVMVLGAACLIALFVILIL